MKLLLIDNYDSFTFNLLHLVSRIPDMELDVRRNDEDFLEDLAANMYDGVIISPGPGTPEAEHYFGKCNEVIMHYGTAGLPILGVCLGFQGIAYAFGASLKRAELPMHGKMSEIEILKSDTIFREVPNRTRVMRYHSLIIDTSKPIPPEIIITAEVPIDASTHKVNGREIMAIEHSSYPIYGVQFHPESFATRSGLQIVENFTALIKKHRTASNV